MNNRNGSIYRFNLHTTSPVVIKLNMWATGTYWVIWEQREKGHLLEKFTIRTTSYHTFMKLEQDIAHSDRRKTKPLTSTKYEGTKKKTKWMNSSKVYSVLQEDQDSKKWKEVHFLITETRRNMQLSWKVFLTCSPRSQLVLGLVSHLVPVNQIQRIRARLIRINSFICETKQWLSRVEVSLKSIRGKLMFWKWKVW